MKLKENVHLLTHGHPTKLTNWARRGISMKQQMVSNAAIVIHSSGGTIC